MGICDLKRQLAPLRHRVARGDREIHDGILKLSGVAVCEPEACGSDTVRTHSCCFQRATKRRIVGGHTLSSIESRIDHGKVVAEVVGNATSQFADSFHLLRLAKPFLELSMLAYIAGDICKADEISLVIADRMNHDICREIFRLSPGTYNRLSADVAMTDSRAYSEGAARKIIECGGSLRDVQELAGHASLATTQCYIAGDAEAKRRVVALL
jgi:hypothetical protein